MVIKGVVENVKVLKENTGKNKDGKFLEVTIDGKKYLSFDKGFVDAVGLEGEFPTKTSEYGGKTNTYVSLPKPTHTAGETNRNFSKEFNETIQMAKESALGLVRLIDAAYTIYDVEHSEKQ
ncbi:MAG: hypothetical protein IPM48_14385 [Saprospiraceae bacterium]|nr:hypothetical protein [Saprospiraceae bacterium]